MPLLLLTITGGVLGGVSGIGDMGTPGGGVAGRRYGVSFGSGPGFRLRGWGDCGGLSNEPDEVLLFRLTC